MKYQCHPCNVLLKIVEMSKFKKKKLLDDIPQLKLCTLLPFYAKYDEPYFFLFLYTLNPIISLF